MTATDAAAVPRADGQPLFVAVSQGPRFRPKLVSFSAPETAHGPTQTFRDAVLTSLVTKREDRLLEADLAHLKWFDYRFMTPAEATQEFIVAYDRIGADMYTRNIGSGYWKLSPKRLWQMPDALKTAFWRARQRADAYCMKYDHFIRYVMGYWFDSGQCGGKTLRIPRPNQLCTNSAVNSAEERWVTHCREVRLEKSLLPQYRTDVYVGLPAQDAHKRWLITQLKMRSPGTRPHALAQLLYSESLLAETDVIPVFGPDEVENARRVAEPAKDAATAMGKLGFFPACYGLPGTASDMCEECIQRYYCRKEAEMASRTAAELAGVYESADARKRRLARERKRAERARKLTASMAKGAHPTPNIGSQTPARHSEGA